jgi:hypothetical protein
LITGASVSIESTTAGCGENDDVRERRLHLQCCLGRYTVTVEARLCRNEKNRGSRRHRPISFDVTVQPPTVTEVVNVVEEVRTSPQGRAASTNLKGTLLDGLPSARTILSAVDLTPAVHATG